MDRISWDKYFIEIVNLVAQRSTCNRFKVGAILVKNNRIIASGYNGAPSGMKHCTENGCMMVNDHCIRTVHAELNALLQAGEKARHATLYCSGSSCPICLKALIQAGVERIVYIQDYRLEESKYWLTYTPMLIEKWKE